MVYFSSYTWYLVTRSTFSWRPAITGYGSSLPQHTAAHHTTQLRNDLMGYSVVALLGTADKASYLRVPHACTSSSTRPFSLTATTTGETTLTLRGSLEVQLVQVILVQSTRKKSFVPDNANNLFFIIKYPTHTQVDAGLPPPRGP